MASMFVLDNLYFSDVAPVSLQIEAGECIGITGESGCGKTRLLRALADMDEHEGSVSCAGTRSDEMSADAWRKQVALLPAESQWWFDRVGEHFDDADIDVSSMSFGQQVLDWQVSRCSSGERQRLAILRCLANQPRVLLLDEPTANLDPDNTLRVEALIGDYIEKHNAACIWVGHNRLQLKRVADRCYEFIDDVITETEC